MAEIVIPIRLTLDDLDAIATAVAAKLQQSFATIYQQEQAMSAELDTLATEVHATSAGIDSAILTLNRLSDRVRALADDPVAIRALADELDQKTAALAAAIVAAPSDPVPDPAPEPPTP